MAKRYFKSVKMMTALISATTLITSTVYGASYQDKIKIEYAGKQITATMSMILDNYLDKDLTVEELYEYAMYGLTYPLDEYSYFMSRSDLNDFVGSLSTENFGIGISFFKNRDNQILIDEVFDKTPAKEVGIKTGDIITHINGIETTKLSLDDISQVIITSKNEVNFIAKRSGEKIEFKVKPREIIIPSITVKTIEEIIGVSDGVDTSNKRYIHISSISEKTDEELKEILLQFKKEGVTELLLDMRNNGGGYLDVIVNIGNMIVPAGPIMSSVDRNGKREIFNSDLEESPFEKIVIIANQYTASAAEVLTSALQDAGIATVVGSKTYGKGVIQGLHSLGLDGLKITEGEYFRRSGKKINGIGVIPNVEIKEVDLLDEAVILRNNNTASNLSHVKEVLKELGYKVGEINNTFDEITKESVKEFQASQGLNVTGYIDLDTEVCMNKELVIHLRENDPVLKQAYKVLIGL